MEDYRKKQIKEKNEQRNSWQLRMEQWVVGHWLTQMDNEIFVTSVDWARDISPLC